MPALLKAQSSLPNVASVRSTIALTSLSFETSVLTKIALPPSSSISAMTAWPSVSRRPLTTTCAPSFANCRAVARPIPALPPVTKTTLPANQLMKFSFSNFSPLVLPDLLQDRACHAAGGRVHPGAGGPSLERDGHALGVRRDGYPQHRSLRERAVMGRWNVPGRLEPRGVHPCHQGACRRRPGAHPWGRSCTRAVRRCRCRRRDTPAPWRRCIPGGTS